MDIPQYSSDVFEYLLTCASSYVLELGDIKMTYHAVFYHYITKYPDICNYLI